MNSDNPKCKWITCAHGMGLAGRGVCSISGDPENPDCPKYIPEEEFLRKWAEEELKNHKKLIEEQQHRIDKALRKLEMYQKTKIESYLLKAIEVLKGLNRAEMNETDTF